MIFNPPEEELPKELGADEGVGLAIATGILLIVVAPVAEEIFFRGFLYQAFRNSFGVWPGAILSGLVFGVIHFEFFKLVQLAILGRDPGAAVRADALAVAADHAARDQQHARVHLSDGRQRLTAGSYCAATACGRLRLLRAARRGGSGRAPRVACS